MRAKWQTLAVLMLLSGLLVGMDFYFTPKEKVNLFCRKEIFIENGWGKGIEGAIREEKGWGGESVCRQYIVSDKDLLAVVSVARGLNRFDEIKKNFEQSADSVLKLEGTKDYGQRGVIVVTDQSSLIRSLLVELYDNRTVAVEYLPELEEKVKEIIEEMET